MRCAPIRRIVTGHDAAGKAVVASDMSLDAVPSPTGDALFTLLWTTASSPADNDDATDGRDRAVGLTLPGGSVIRVVEMPPGKRSTMHRTNSLEYGIVLSGSIELELDDGVVAVAEVNAIIIQRGTIHAWRNLSPDQPARIAFVLLDATPATIDGRPLPETPPRTGVQPSR